MTARFIKINWNVQNSDRILLFDLAFRKITRVNNMDNYLKQWRTWNEIELLNVSSQNLRSLRGPQVSFTSDFGD